MNLKLNLQRQVLKNMNDIAGLKTSTTNIESDIASIQDDIADLTALNLENGTGTDAIKQKMTDAEENENIASGNFSSALGHGNNSAAKGTFTAGGEGEATADHAATIGYKCRATKGNALALGCRTTATGDSAIAQGYSNNQASRSITDSTSLADIKNAYHSAPFTLAQRYGSHAKGQNTVAYSQNSTAEGQGTFAFGDCQHAFGKFNDYSDSKSKLVRVTGWGTSNTSRRNIEELDRDGTLDIAGTPKTLNSVIPIRFMKDYPMLLNCVNFVKRNWTSSQWNQYGALNHYEDAWNGTNHNTKEIEGTFFALYGTATDTDVKFIVILHSKGGNPTDPNDQRCSGRVVAKYDYANRLFAILGLS